MRRCLLLRHLRRGVVAGWRSRRRCSASSLCARLHCRWPSPAWRTAVAGRGSAAAASAQAAEAEGDRASSTTRDHATWQAGG